MIEIQLLRSQSFVCAQAVNDATSPFQIGSRKFSVLHLDFSEVIWDAENPSANTALSVHSH